MSIGTTWQTYLSLFLASLLQLPHSAAGHPFTLCGKNELGVSSVEFVPDPPRHGQNLEVTISGVSNVDVNGGTARMTVKLFGQTIDEELYDICSDLGIPCPNKIGYPYKAIVNKPIPGALWPGLKLQVEISVFEMLGSRIACVRMPITVQSTRQRNLTDFGGTEEL
eukprot:CAMPEP_0170166500 /NCGR_PEP_ID=MMETSP0040_2-20121228/153_1 /TAXON_ID=641309 /ORGANISM="Lotharella oceanica, Strain CCMP622" /LENGTH=165 /DNA_ID=CAMNT_0010404227 /DNA_START=21 /DNA_END=518 /DNA_ORIENTATION=+